MVLKRLVACHRWIISFRNRSAVTDCDPCSKTNWWAAYLSRTHVHGQLPLFSQSFIRGSIISFLSSSFIFFFPLPTYIHLHLYSACWLSVCILSLCKFWLQVTVIVSFLVLLVAGSWGVTQVKDGLDLTDIVPRETTEFQFLKAQEQYFGFYSIYAVTKVIHRH